MIKPLLSMPTPPLFISLARVEISYREICHLVVVNQLVIMYHFSNLWTLLRGNIKMIRIITLLIASFLSVGCAKINATHINQQDQMTLPHPTRILITYFRVDSESIQTSTGIFAKIKSAVTNESAETTKQELSSEVIEALNKELVVKITALGITAVHAEQNQQPVENEIIITGKFLKIDEGNAIRRNLIGLGAGQSSLDSKVIVLRATPQGIKEILSFSAHADSGNMPGAVVLGPAGVAAGAGAAVIAATNVAKGAAATYKSNSANQASALADKISEVLQKYFQEQGWIK